MKEATGGTRLQTGRQLMIGGRATIGPYGPTEDHQPGETARDGIQKTGIITTIDIQEMKGAMIKEVTDRIMDEMSIIMGNTTEEMKGIIQGMEEETRVEVKDRRRGTEIIPIRETKGHGGRTKDRGPHVKYSGM